MKVGRRRVAVVVAVAAVLVAGTGVARAYYAPGAEDLHEPAGYFTFCADRQRDIAGITADDLAPAPTGQTIASTDFVYDRSGPLWSDQPWQGTTPSCSASRGSQARRCRAAAS